MSTPITISAIVESSIETVWEAWTSPEDITQWNAASDDWHCPSASNDLQVGGRLRARMEARDGSMGFDFEGVYTEVRPHSALVFRLEDDREVRVEFMEVSGAVQVTETFDPDPDAPDELQRDGWQAILNRFKSHVEGKA